MDSKALPSGELSLMYFVQEQVFLFQMMLVIFFTSGTNAIKRHRMGYLLILITIIIISISIQYSWAKSMSKHVHVMSKNKIYNMLSL